MKPGKENLEALINEADASVRKAEQNRSALTHTRQRKYSQTTLLWMVCLLVWAYTLWSSTISDGEIRMDLEKLLLSARTQIDERISIDGQLPAAIPDVALRKVVHYEILDAAAKPPRYQLVAKINGVSQRWPAN